MRTYLVLIFFLVFTLNSCNSDKKMEISIPKNIIEKDSFIVVMTDFRLVEASIRQMVAKGENSQKMTKYYYSFILKKHKITYEDFDYSLKFYSKDPKEMDEIYSKVVSNLNEMQSKVSVE